MDESEQCGPRTAGLWVLMAPFALGYGAVQAAVANDVIVGLLVLVFGVVRAMAPARMAEAR